MWKEYERDINVSALLSLEVLQYYSTAMFWMRVTSNKKRAAMEPLTPEEKGLVDLMKENVFNVPEPVTLYLKSVGTIVPMGGEHLRPIFPTLPNRSARADTTRMGYFGPLSVATHNLYEEYPCLGVMADALCALSNDAGEYISPLSTNALTVTHNLPGYAPINHLSNKITDMLNAHGINNDQFHQTIENTGINAGLLRQISNILSNTTIFRVTPYKFMDISRRGHHFS